MSLLATGPTGTSAHHRGDLLTAKVRAGTSSVIRDLLHLVDQPGMLSLAGGLPAPELLPVDAVAAAAASLLADDGARALQYAPTEGVPELRAQVAARHTRTGHPATTADVLVTTGSQQGLDLLARALLEPGDTVVVEAPGYLGALQAFDLTSATVEAVTGDRDGLRTDDLEARLLAGLRPKLVYVVTNFQNPSGATLSEPRRHHLAILADRYGFVLVEDDPYGELRFRGESLPRLACFTDQAVTLGTASKILSPGLRVGWVVAPPWLMEALVRLKQVADLHTAPLNQLVVADLLADEPFLAGHLDELRGAYRPRAEALVAAVRAMPGTPIAIEAPDGGMFCWARLTDGRPADELLAAAVAGGVAFVPGSAFHRGGTGRDTLRLCFSTLTPAELDEAVSRLGSVLASPR